MATDTDTIAATLTRADFRTAGVSAHWDLPRSGRQVEPDAPSPAAADPGRRESEEQREDRNLMELLQELRVAAIGVQVLFGFLLALPFTTRFTSLSSGQRYLYVAVLVLAALATAQLSGPVAYHRMVFRQHKKAGLLRVANVLALSGMATAGASIVGAMLLITSFVLHGVAVPLLVVAVGGSFVVMWLVVPLVARERGR